MANEADAFLQGRFSVGQLAVEDLPDGHWDVIVVGGGPGGSVAAMELASLGHRVLLCDRQWFPREKVCGDGLTPAAMRLLRRFGMCEEVEAVGHRCASLSIFSPSRVRIDMPADYLTVRREIYDALLVRRAAAAGVTFVRGTARLLGHRPDGAAEVVFREGGRRHAAACCLLATGTRLDLARQAGLGTAAALTGAALRCYVRSSLPLDQLVIACEAAVLPGYAWIFPVGQGLFNVGCGLFMQGRRNKRINLKRVFASFLRDFPLTRRLLAQGQVETPWQGALLRSGWRQVLPMARGPYLGIGEMVGTTSPYTGEGIGKAMQSGILAARLAHRCLLRGDVTCLQRMPVYLGQLAGLRYGDFNRTRRWFLSPALVDFVAGRIHNSPYLYNALQGILQEKVDPAQVFSWRRVWRSFRF